MRGFMKTKSALNQFLVLISVVLVSFFVIGILGTFILSAVSGIGLSEMADLSKADLSRPEFINLLRGMQALQFISLFLVPVLICSWLFSTDTRKYTGLRAPSHRGYLLAGIAIMLVAIPFTGWLGELNKNIPFPSGMEKWMKAQEVEASRTIEALLSRRTIGDLFLNLISVAGFAAIGEELLFRGMAQRLLIKMFRSPWAGILVAAAIFSAMHMQFYGFLPRFALGILLGLIYWYSGSLWVSILAHFVYDAVLVFLTYNNPALLAEEKNIEMGNLAVAGTISLLLVITIIIWMRRNTKAGFERVYAGDNIPVRNHPFDFEQNTPE